MKGPLILALLAALIFSGAMSSVKRDLQQTAKILSEVTR